MPPYCRICKATFRNFHEVLQHILSAHPNELTEYWRHKYTQWLQKRDWECKDCIHAGVIYVSDDDKLKKGCPDKYLFNHPNPLECPNFVPKDE